MPATALLAVIMGASAPATLVSARVSLCEADASGPGQGDSPPVRLATTASTAAVTARLATAFACRFVGRRVRASAAVGSLRLLGLGIGHLIFDGDSRLYIKTQLGA